MQVFQLKKNSVVIFCHQLWLHLKVLMFSWRRKKKDKRRKDKHFGDIASSKLQRHYKNQVSQFDKLFVLVICNNFTICLLEQLDLSFTNHMTKRPN